jgi:hypothetical protein
MSSSGSTQEKLPYSQYYRFIRTNLAKVRVEQQKKYNEFVEKTLTQAKTEIIDLIDRWPSERPLETRIEYEVSDSKNYTEQMNVLALHSEVLIETLPKDFSYSARRNDWSCLGFQPREDGECYFKLFISLIDKK